MDLEEQRLRHQIEDRERALKEKITTLKERLEHFKSLIDVKAQVRQHPGLMVTGSIFAGFLTKKLVGRKDRHTPYPERVNSHPAPSPGNPAGAILSAIAARAAIGIVGEVLARLLPRKDEKSPQNVGTNWQRY